MPENILWRPVQIISNSLSTFQQKLTNYLTENMSDLYFDTNKNKLLNENTNGAIPITKEDLYYRLIFRKYYPSRDYLVPFYWGKIWDLDLD
jgi:isoleucyl-tRNA synthetase